jgi:hypothetical protein
LELIELHLASSTTVTNPGIAAWELPFTLKVACHPASASARLEAATSFLSYGCGSPIAIRSRTLVSQLLRNAEASEFVA